MDWIWMDGWMLNSHWSLTFAGLGQWRIMEMEQWMRWRRWRRGLKGNAMDE
jgi:hypothetical protein